MERENEIWPKGQITNKNYLYIKITNCLPTRQFHEQNQSSISERNSKILIQRPNLWFDYELEHHRSVSQTNFEKLKHGSMGQSKAMRRCSRGGIHLPTDVVFSILVHLPVQSLLRFRHVCKQWRSLLTDPHFISMHSLNHQLIYLVSDDKKRMCTWKKTWGKVSDHTFLYLTGLPDNAATKIFHGSCYGLVCFSGHEPTGPNGDYDYSSFELEFYLWNPSVNRINLVGSFSQVKSDRHVSGLGLSKNGDCKLVKVSLCSSDMISYSPCAISVYTLSTNSWKQPIIDIFDTTDVVFNAGCHAIPVYFNGSMHWLGDDKHALPIRSKLILSFDLQNELLRQIALPKCDFEGGELSSIYLGKHQKCLSLMSYTRSKICIWMMNEYGVKDSWSQLYSIINDSTKQIQVAVYLGNLGLMVKTNKDGLFMFDFEEQKWIDVEKDVGFTRTTSCSVIDFTQGLLLPPP